MLKPTIKNTQHNIDELFDTLKELSVKNKTISKEEKELLKEIFTQQILDILNSTYNALNYLNEKLITNELLTKFENNPSSINNYITLYEQLMNKAKENEDENLKWRCEFTVGFFKEMKKNYKKAIQILHLMIAGNLILDCKEYHSIYMTFLKNNNQKEYKKINRLYENKDLFINLYAQIEGYKISHKQILKSAGLKIFNFFEIITKVQKNSLAQKIEYIFASLGEDVSIDSKRASYIRVIGEFNNIILLDYEGNKKATLNDFGLSKIIDNILAKIIKDLKKSGQKDIIKQLNKNIKFIETSFLQQLLS